MASQTRRSRGVAVLLAALVTTGCSSAGSTQDASEGTSGTPFTLYTHCGVENVRLDGRWWHARRPLYNDERSGPPAGWGDPHQEGTLTMESAERAVFEARGQRVVFAPAPDDEPVRVCR